MHKATNYKHTYLLQNFVPRINLLAYVVMNLANIKSFAVFPQREQCQFKCKVFMIEKNYNTASPCPTPNCKLNSCLPPNHSNGVEVVKDYFIAHH